MFNNTLLCDNMKIMLRRKSAYHISELKDNVYSGSGISKKKFKNQNNNVIPISIYMFY